MVGELVFVEDFKEFGAGEGLGVAADGTEHPEDLRAFAVLCRRDLLQIVQTPVEFVAGEVVDFHARCAWSDKGLPHQMMTETVFEIAHTRVCPTV